MTSEPFKPSVEEIKKFLAVSLVTGAAFIAYSTGWEPLKAAKYLGIGFIVILIRELGQRTIAQWMDADVELNISFQGSVLTIFGAFLSVLGPVSFILLFPVYNNYSTTSYEQWGKSVDAIWLKRQFYLISGGFFALILGWGASYFLGAMNLAEAFSLFLVFQLLPFDYHSIPTGPLDGATVLKESGFIWLTYFGIAWTTLAMVWV